VKDSIPNNNEFEAAEKSLRKIGSNMWFGGLTDEWQDFLASHTVEHFDTYEISMEQAAESVIRTYQRIVAADPRVVKSNPWNANLSII
jgi:hypothetical protein